MQKGTKQVGQVMWFGIALILILIPFHALLTAWFASNFGYFDAIRLWKEFLLYDMTLAAVAVLVRDVVIRRKLTSNRLVRALFIYLIFCLAMTLYGLFAHHTTLSAAAYGFIIQSRPFLFIFIILVASTITSPPKQWLKWFVVPAVAVISIGLLQQFVLKPDFLRHFGYGSSTLPAFQPVDNKPDLARVQSTLRGPNPLGAYLVPLLILVSALTLTYKKYRVHYAIILLAGVLVLLGSYSRSALLGFVLALATYGSLQLRSKKQKQIFVIVVACLFVLVGASTYALRNNDSFQNFAFHTNEKSTSSTSSNSLRLSSLKNGAKDVLKHPFGEGVGTAGPASTRNSGHAPRIAENYFIQTGQEMGIVGLVLFVLVLGALGRALWAKRSDTVVQVVLASGVGLIWVNMVSHAWADDTLAYIFFGLFALALQQKPVQKAKTLLH